AAHAPIEVLHREVHTVELATRDRQITRDARAGGEDHGVVGEPQLLRVDIPADVDAQPERHALRLELADAALDELPLDLELRHAEAHGPAGRLVALEDGDRVARARELLCACEPGRPGANDGDGLPRLRRRRTRNDPAFVPRPVHDRELDLLDRHGVALVDLEHARRLARRRAEAARELRKVVRAVELRDRVLPPVAVDEIVPARDQVLERAARLTEGHAALHATPRLVA